MLFDGHELGVELKALDKPKYRQATDRKVSFPTDQWVRVTWHVHLHPDDGHVQIWQDEQLVVMLQKQNMLTYIEARSISFSQADGLLIRSDVRQNVIGDHPFNGVPNVFFVETAHRHSTHAHVS